MMRKFVLTRRGALASMTSVFALAFAGGGMIPGLARAAVPPDEMATPAEMATMTALAHAIFPHKQLPMSFYRKKAAAYLAEIERSSAGMAQLNRGLKILDGSHIAPFRELPAVIQDSMVEKVDQAPFFKAYLWRLSELIYRDPVVWKMVGYEGSSLEYGGYLHRGFDDIDWLPARPGGAA